jgi:GTPase SAR1 family protein
MKVAVCGPPHSGKSTFTASLIGSIRKKKREQPFNIAFTWVPLDVTDNSIAAMLNPDDDSIPRKRDVDWTNERAEERQAVFQSRDEDLVLADSPGKITEQLRIVVSPADAIILLCSHEKRDLLDEWIDFVEEMDCELFAVLTTVLDEDIDAEWDDRSSRKGVIRSVEREDFERRQIDALDDTTHRMLKQLIKDLVNRAVE